MRAKDDMKGLTTQIGSQDVQIDELKAQIVEKDNLQARTDQDVHALQLELTRQKEQMSKLDEDNFKAKMMQLEQLETMKAQLQQIE